MAQLQQPPSLNTQVSYTPQGRISLIGKTQLARLLNPASANSDWRLLAAHLGCPDTDIQNYEARNGVNMNYNVTVEVLRDWERRFKGPVNLNELKTVLSIMGRQDALGTIQDLIDADKFFDRQPTPPSPSSSMSSEGSPRVRPRQQAPFPPPTVIAGFQQAPQGDDIFKSELQAVDDSRREPMEDSYSSLTSTDLPPDSTMPDIYAAQQPPISQGARLRTIIRPPNGRQNGPYNNSSTVGVNGGPPPLPENFTHNLPVRRSQHTTASGSQMFNRGSPTKQLPASQQPLGARPKTTHRSQNESQMNSSEEPANMKRSASCENYHSSSSSDRSISSGESYDSRTWPDKDHPFKGNGKSHSPKKSPQKLPQTELEVRVAGDYRSHAERVLNSWPLDHRHRRTDTSLCNPNDEPSHHRQISRERRDNSLTDVSWGITPAPHQCKSGIAYGITYAWKDWKCGMDLAKKLKHQGHHVEVDRKRVWYKDEKERDRKLSRVLGSCKYIIVIITPNYEKEIRGEVESEVNARFIFQYMREEYIKNNKENKRFIPIVDTTRVQQADKMFDKYPVEEHSYIVRLIRQQGVIVERQYSVN